MALDILTLRDLARRYDLANRAIPASSNEPQVSGLDESPRCPCACGCGDPLTVADRQVCRQCALGAHAPA